MFVGLHNHQCNYCENIFPFPYETENPVDVISKPPRQSLLLRSNHESTGFACSGHFISMEPVMRCLNFSHCLLSLSKSFAEFAILHNRVVLHSFLWTNNILLCLTFHLSVNDPLLGMLTLLAPYCPG